MHNKNPLNCPFGLGSTEELTMEQESEGVEQEEEESVCLLYNTIRTHLGW